MENMARRKGLGFNHDFATMFIEFPDDLEVTVCEASRLPDGWRNYTDHTICQQIGDEWYDNAATPILKVPSAVITEEYNYVLNSSHPEFKKITIKQVNEYFPDERIEQILKA
jgi:RES domain-containing protein